MEAVEMNGSSVDSAVQELSQLEGNPRLTSSMKEQIKILQMQLGFFEMYLLCLDQCNSHTGTAEGSSIEATHKKAEKSLYKSGIAALDTGEFEDWDFLVSNMLERIQICKPTIKTNCLDLLDCVFEFKFSISDLQKFMDCIVISWNNLVRMKANMFADLKIQMEALKVKVNLFPQLIDFSMKRSKSRKAIKALAIHLQPWAYSAACLSILYWAEDGKEENLAAKLNLVLSDLLQKSKLCKPEITGMYLRVLRTSRSSPSDIGQTGEVVANFVDFLLESMVFHVQDEIQTLREGLIILIIFRVEKFPECKRQDELKSVMRQADVLVDDAASFICSISVDKLKESILQERSCFLIDLIERIDKVKGSITNLYPPALDSSSVNYPTTNLPGFIDLVLEIIKSKPISMPSITHQFAILREELMSLRPFLKDIQQLPNKHDEVNELWQPIANIAYKAAHVVRLFCFKHHCLWNKMTSLYNVTEEIKLIKSEVLRTQKKQSSKVQDANAEISSNLMLPVQANPSRIDQVVGFEEEAKIIIDRLTKGSRELDIVSIVGMPGLGKTTLAKKVYDDASIKYHFHKFAWSCVSQSYNCKKLLFEILRDVIGLDDDIKMMAEEDLAERLYRSLKGQRYLIILDDIWNIRAWDELKQSFPDDGNGSRVMFTSRIHNIALQAKSNCIPHPLNPLSDEESWMLLQQKLFNRDGCPPTFSEVGMQIAKNCKGLPLAIVVVAGLLARRAESLDWWKQIAETLSSLVATEGCMAILELSYKHLPEFLKPCFLYLGMFVEDQEIKVQKLIRLWISEGLVQNSGMRNLENIAKGYLMDLVTRSLVTLSSRSSTGGIKACRIHDLLREFCLVTGEKENFFRVICRDGVPDYPRGFMYKYYRLCIQSKWKSFLKSHPTGPCLHFLMVYQNDRFEYYHLRNFNFSNFECLQVLDMEDFCFASYNRFEVIASLVLLRYLAVRCDFIRVPPSIVQLVNLETISLRSSEPSKAFELPENIWMSLKKLRHVDMTPKFRDRSISSQQHEPGESSRLEHLQTFSTLSIREGDKAESLLGRMSRVRKLKFFFEKDAQFPMLHFLTELESVNLEYNWRVSMTYPYAMNFPLTLKKLTLSYFLLPWSAISSMGNLPNLEVLKLLYYACDGERWDVEDGEFLKLKFLKLQYQNLAQWNIPSDDPFPSLEQLVVHYCSQLEEIPSCFGNIPTLKRIEVCGCSSEVCNSARQIQEEQLDLGNEDLQLLIINEIEN